MTILKPPPRLKHDAKADVIKSNIEQLAQFPLILNGAYLRIMNQIASTYQYTSPANSRLYQLLADRVGPISEDEKSKCIQALNNYLDTQESHLTKLSA